MFHQEGPNSISVFKLQSRTTSALEAYNGVLGKKVMTKGHFFKFITILQAEEFSKSAEFSMLIESGGGSKKNNKKKKVN